MTLAIDKQSGAVIGQVLEPRRDIDATTTWMLTVLTRDGVKTVSRASVRLERMGD